MPISLENITFIRIAFLTYLSAFQDSHQGQKGLLPTLLNALSLVNISWCTQRGGEGGRKEGRKAGLSCSLQGPAHRAFLPRAFLTHVLVPCNHQQSPDGEKLQNCCFYGLAAIMDLGIQLGAVPSVLAGHPPGKCWLQKSLPG